MTNTVNLFEIGDLVLGISDQYFDDVLMGVVLQKKKLMGFYCYKIQWVLDVALNDVSNFEMEWLKEKELSLYKKSIII